MSGGDSVYERARVAAAMKGHLGDKKSVLIFSKGRAGANAHLHSFEAHGDLTDIHRDLLDDGVSDHLLIPRAGGATVYVVDIGDWAHEAVDRASARHGERFRSEIGRAEFIPPIIVEGTDREQRDHARKAYEEVIRRSPIKGIREKWRKLRDRWRDDLGEKTGGGAAS
ncbi:hypothetical protein SAMN05444161_7536 [Rhizobiales bacterium GAS191]|nr:hypothetical protein SAMN05444161_7536 [Rhizobiales bacterium GAS191]